MKQTTQQARAAASDAELAAMMEPLVQIVTASVMLNAPDSNYQVWLHQPSGRRYLVTLFPTGKLMFAQRWEKFTASETPLTHYMDFNEGVKLWLDQHRAECVRIVRGAPIEA